MKKIIFSFFCLLAICASAGVAPANRAWPVFRGSGSAPLPPYWWDTAYAKSKIILEFSTTNNPTLDSSVIGTNNGTLGVTSKKPTWSSSTNTTISGSAHYYFDGGDEISCPPVPSVCGTNKRTVIFWYRSGETADRRPFGWGNTSANGATFDCYLRRTVNQMQMSLNNRNRIWTWTPLTNWSMITIVLSAPNASNLTAYVNTTALSIVSTSAGSIDTANTPIWIGRGALTNGINGRIDGFKVYNEALSLGQIRTNYLITVTNYTGR